MKKITFGILCVFLSFLIGTSQAQTSASQIEAVVDQLLENNELQSNDTQWVVTDQSTSTISGVTHVYYRQVVNGLEVYGTESGIHLTASGDVLTQNNHFINQATNRAVSGNTPSISAAQAVQAVADQLGYNINGGISVVASKEGVAQETLLSKSGISLSEIPAKLTYQLNDNDELVLVWDLSIQEISGHDWWSLRVDANTGNIVDKVNWIVSCNLSHDHSADEAEILDYNKNLYNIPNYTEAVETENMPPNSYEVIAIPTESPYFAPRTIVTSPEDLTASPFGWHDTNGVPGAEFTTTRGNNVNAYEDGDNQGFQPDGGIDLDFTGAGFPFDQNYSNATQYEAAAITNLFYWNNIIHDVLFQYGFDEASGNFQETNYSGAGAGSDSVNAEAQDGSGTCNANFGTPPDGSNPTMQMYVCGDKDGDFDNLVIVHEYGHGVSNRLTGGPSQSGCLGNSEQMGEGWSDYLGAILTMNPGDMATDARPVGTYLFGQGPTGGGIRSFPYSTDFSINPQTYDYIKTESVPHGVGSVWATMLWELTWELIAEHGVDNNIYNFTGDVNLDAGNVQALALVMEGMKLQPCSPGFVDGRDAIFAADQALYGGANECLIWDAFARRGLGVSADQGSSNSRSDGTEAFDTPTGVASFVAPEDVCASADVLTGLSGGTPFGGMYSGPGVTDDGNGNTYSFDPGAAGVGVHSITYTVQANDCTVASSDSDTIEVLAIPNSPTTTGDMDICVGDAATVTATPVDPANVIRWYDAQNGGNFLFEGTDYTFNPTGNTTVYAQENPPGPLSQLVISELTLETPDRLEIQNVGIAQDYSGYTVAVSEQPYTNINTQNSVEQTLGAMGADSVVTFSDESGNADYWGDNIWWDNDGTGWIIVIDDAGNVVDSVFWNFTAAEISGLNVTINGFNITAADLDWSGPGAALTADCGESFKRFGETDSSADWSNTCDDETYGVAGDVGLGFAGCLAERAPAQVTVDAVDPTITCPADETVTVNQGEQYTLPDYTGVATATDNCAATPVISQNPTAGTQVGPGVTQITMTATDAAGNEATCTFDVTVEENILSIEELSLKNGIALYPNPTTGMVTISNNSEQVLTNAVVTDVNGRTIYTIDLSGANATTLSLENVATGLYFVRINSEQASIIKRIIKR
ncbi:M36 family metallopeptidase [Marinirhabdus gelatinilytica]|uniref:Extracellular elastinolytic metalloproteinase n=1 Tax=Marinirhabdus gelatinilytica TaxID=1703343 RepID=A0A370QFG3_9FLAO|nr:M36 family metallopeptidase [Marinirhabdus gelatinilytica]RDK87105.1 extracellular elastinolytic metalloproteinase [Marinirhabdus gelatinilytica]